MYKYLLIDCDDTILDFQASERAAITIVLNNHGVEPTKKAIARYIKINEKFWHLYEKGKISRDRLLELRFIKFFKKYHMDVDGASLNKEYLDTLANNVYIIDGIEDVLKYLQSKYHLYIITNGVKATQEKRWNQTPLLKYFDGTFISEDIGFHKPQKEYFDYVINSIGEKDLSQYLVIGDSIASDILGGVNYGIDVAWYNPRHKKTKLEINYEFDNINKYQEIL